MDEFSLTAEMLRDILLHARPLGHNEVPKRLNLGFGFFYYGLVRALRPRHVLVIGSGYGFSVVCFALGVKDNDDGRVTFVDPSYSLLKDGPFKTIGGNNQWSEPQKVREHFRQFGVEHVVSHHRQTSAEFFGAYDQHALPAIDVAFIDGSHAYEDVRHDFLRTVEHAHKNSYIFLHDTHLYVRELLHHAGVKRWLRIVKRQEEYFEVVNFPFSSGVALVRVINDKVWSYPIP